MASSATLSKELFGHLDSRNNALTFVKASTPTIDYNHLTSFKHITFPKLRKWLAGITLYNEAEDVIFWYDVTREERSRMQDAGITTAILLESENDFDTMLLWLEEHGSRVIEISVVSQTETRTEVSVHDDRISGSPATDSTTPQRDEDESRP